MTWDAPAPTSGCHDGHPDTLTPGVDPRLGLVPTRAATWLGAVVLAVGCAALWWWVPGLRPVLPVVLIVWWVVTGLVQLALGHRGRCALVRTVRWFFGPAGALLDLSDGS